MLCPFLPTAQEQHWYDARGFWQHVGGQSGYPWYMSVCMGWEKNRAVVTELQKWDFLTVPPIHGL